jgi:hypothetical protein
MARSQKDPFGLVLILLIVIAFSTYVAYSMTESFRSADCKGVTCPEGEFCQQNTCKAIYPRV